MNARATNDAVVIALRALAATLAHEQLAERFLSLTGLTPPELRQRAADERFLAEVLRFLEAHEPDLVTIAAEMGVGAGNLVAARRELER